MSKFELRQLLATPGRAKRCGRRRPDGVSSAACSRRLGVVDAADKRANDRALIDDSRLFSAYMLRGGRTRIWIITEADKAATTVLLPSEY